MQRNVLEYLEATVRQKPEKTAYANEEMGITFREVYDYARAIGTFLGKEKVCKEPVLVFMRKHPSVIVAFYGIVYGGNYYVPIDEEMPKDRIRLIFEKLNPKAVICDETTKDMIPALNYKGKIFLYETIIKTVIQEDIIARIRDAAIDTDPIYIVFTSGSTGIPKGVVACHRSVIDYIENLSEVLQFNENTVFGNQTPLYVDACLKELYPTLKFGATTYLIPKSLFRFPVKLVEFLNQYKINTVCWVVSALTMISAFGALDKVIPKYLHTIAFGSEVFPIKQFNLWKQALPGARFFNLYGPTEATGMSCYYYVDRNFDLEEVMPVGRPFHNTEIILLDEQNKVPSPGGTGEICIRGTALTLGYYGDFDKTREAFIQNPLNTVYPELIYRTGDLGRYNERGELIFISRKDNQIKHMGHRIELGEIEMIVNNLDEVKAACCLFDENKKKIILYYVGSLKDSEIINKMKEKLPRYMLPNVIKSLEEMPLTPNGKINRLLLKESYTKGR
ncbi:AMP-binding protein [Anaerocolumna sedimenticola]|uniref:AMP-binding protein n=1 Tax=Anaerocolumna sedimenticola TaxID=2696063 RepID=A0A6P1TJ49_9FIRM|nr:amino acid adenylation domain-containing protein [Anaerocolumna sedimenticola]QHQ60139.1 AMP-binding protein [Anaerocolumna sedimenticola]